jgi:hypothetical protein
LAWTPPSESTFIGALPLPSAASKIACVFMVAGNGVLRRKFADWRGQIDFLKAEPKLAGPMKTQRFLNQHHLARKLGSFR